MKEILEMAGEQAAHAVWGLSSEDTVSPSICSLDSDGKNTRECLMVDWDDARRLWEQRIEQPQADVDGACFVFTSALEYQDIEIPVLRVDVQSFNEDKFVSLLIPFREQSSEQGFAIMNPLISSVQGFSDEERNWIMETFAEGIKTHTFGHEAWQKALDEHLIRAVKPSDEDAEHIATLKRAPLLMFFLISAADGKIDRKEVIEFAKIIGNPDNQVNPVLKAVLSDISDSAAELLVEMAAEGLNYELELQKLQVAVDQCLPSDDANDFKKALWELGEKIASASGGFWGFGSKISKEETMALDAIADILKIQH